MHESVETMPTNNSQVARSTKVNRPTVIDVAGESYAEIGKHVYYVIRAPSIDPIFCSFVNSVAIQAITYYVAKERRCPIDMPRNLAKSVIIEQEDRPVIVSQPSQSRIIASSPYRSDARQP